ncbi:hypothetical protein H257_07315 [Aphanomyces astaci]|uniref:WRKY19-like zinc finger domain-containing protein n=1 Tax=Aphanomyces astaci TaxID=112090 RepID=W4GIV8_APHAT|nr:hypothetical protein H257_07315 [Aphanomyces astaci]ETV79251.1 hypothetical protein H257_07315 [Aphanomyces astaci]|eukprot:XP_009831092.1 hypothetical protein H257_07315 [Aphanomyces astaci]
MLHVDLNDDLAEFIDVTFASGDNVVVVVVGQRDVANDARLQTTLAELPQQVLFRRQQSMVTIEEDVELHSINRPSLGSTSERDRRKQSMVQSNSIDDKTLGNKGLEDEEYYERIVTSISTQPLEHFMASLDDESAESVADSDVSSDVSYSSTTYDAESDGHHDDTTLFESIRASDEFHRVFEWMQEYRGWSRQPGIWGSYCYIEPRTPPEHQAAETSEESASEFLGEVAAEAKWKATGDWHRALFAQPPTVNEPVVPLTTPSRRPRRQKTLCSMPGCSHAAATNRLCRGHGGGKTCSTAGCLGTAMGVLGKCKKHGGGARCSELSCSKSAQGGGRCKAHGGGKKCSFDGCARAAQRRGRCASHGGKIPCRVHDCPRTDRGGGLCEVHRVAALCVFHGCHRLAKVNQLCAPHSRQQRSALNHQQSAEMSSAQATSSVYELLV